HRIDPRDLAADSHYYYAHDPHAHEAYLERRFGPGIVLAPLAEVAYKGVKRVAVKSGAMDHIEAAGKKAAHELGKGLGQVIHKGAQHVLGDNKGKGGGGKPKGGTKQKGGTKPKGGVKKKTGRVGSKAKSAVKKKVGGAGGKTKAAVKK